jgi:hypothetical protein
MSLLLDSSAALAWIYSDETTEPIRRLFDAVADDGAVSTRNTMLRAHLGFIRRTTDATCGRTRAISTSP